jgi:hypothetical protein
METVHRIAGRTWIAWRHQQKGWRVEGVESADADDVPIARTAGLVEMCREEEAQCSDCHDGRCWPA